MKKQQKIVNKNNNKKNWFKLNQRIYQRNFETKTKFSKHKKHDKKIILSKKEKYRKSHYALLFSRLMSSQ